MCSDRTRHMLEVRAKERSRVDRGREKTLRASSLRVVFYFNIYGTLIMIYLFNSKGYYSGLNN